MNVRFARMLLLGLVSFLSLLADRSSRAQPTADFDPSTVTVIDSDEILRRDQSDAERGEMYAQFALGLRYATGNRVPKDEAKAVEWYRKAAAQGYAHAQLNLGVCYEAGRGVAMDEVQAVMWYRNAAEQNLADAQYRLGVCYEAGRGIATDLVESVKWYRKAADQNLAKAQHRLGIFYAIGKGVAKDEAEAAKWYRKAADHNFASGQLDLGICYRQGQGVAKDEDEAVKWFRKAADQNLAHAQYYLGNCYAHGEGVAKDEVEAVKWYRLAASKDDSSAQWTLGLFYEQGRGVAKDEAEAVKWYRKAANQNFALAQLNLGVCYAEGQGVIKSEIEAYKWFLLAGSQGSDFAKKRIRGLEARLTAEQRAEGQRLARDFKPRKTLEPGTTDSPEGVLASRPSSTGTGFFITDDGYLISNAHVVEGATHVRLVTSAGTIAAKVVKVDAANDLALLKADGRFAALPVVASRSVRLGSTVATVGFPNVGLQGFSPKLAKGEIAALSGAQDDARHFQISVPVQPGNSGGSLVDERGNVVGVVSAKLNAETALAASGALPENVNYAVKSSFLLSFLESVPAVAAKLKDAATKDREFEDVVKSAEQAAVLVLVY